SYLSSQSCPFSSMRLVVVRIRCSDDRKHHHYTLQAAPTPLIYTLSLPTLFRSPIYNSTIALMTFDSGNNQRSNCEIILSNLQRRSEEHTSELQSRFDLVCRHLIEKIIIINIPKYNEK